MKRLFLAASAAAALLAAPAARAQSGVRSHDGFYLHLELGGGALGTKATTDVKEELSGGGSQLAISVGGAVTPELVIAGQLWSTGVNDPTYKVDGRKIAISGDTSIGMGGLGLELTYFFMPLNAYVSAVPSITALSSKVNGTSASSQRGFGLKLAVGKEWFVSDNWGLGLNVAYAFSSNKDKEEPGVPTATWKSSWFGLALSATFN